MKSKEICDSSVKVSPKSVILPNRVSGRRVGLFPLWIILLKFVAKPVYCTCSGLFIRIVLFQSHIIVLFISHCERIFRLFQPCGHEAIQPFQLFEATAVTWIFQPYFSPIAAMRPWDYSAISSHMELSSIPAIWGYCSHIDIMQLFSHWSHASH